MWTANTAARLPVALPEPDDEFAAAVIDGLSKPRKTLPCRFFYDARGSELFEAITRLPEYYPTRTEAQILSTHAADICDAITDASVLIEFGSGSSLKTEILLDRVADRVTYVPVDVSESALADARRRLERRYPALDVRPIVGDFSYPIRLADGLRTRPRTGFFPGSTIGNLTPAEAVRLLGVFRTALPAGGRLIIGIDLKKDARKLVLAYNDSAGVTAAFNLNILARISRQLGCAIDLGSFRHEAIYDPREGRIEMHLVSTRDQDAKICGRRIRFRAGESIHTENSYKYTVGEFQDLALREGWSPARVWTDGNRQFSVHELISP